MRLKIAAAQYPIDFLDDWEQFERKLSGWVAEAAAEGAELLVFPEYGAMELASLFAPEVYGDLGRQLEALQELLEDYRALYQRLAARHELYILAGSFPARVGEEYRNRAYFYGPESESFQEKLIMTRFERDQWGISPGHGMRVFETRFGRIGVTICYDSEFPLIARAQVEAGADLILAPSCTDTDAGYHRVRIGCQARALENQCYLVQSPTVGVADWSEAVDRNFGAAAIYGPVDSSLCADGVVAIGERDRPQWVYGEIDTEQARALREQGQVLNYLDWPRQQGWRLEPVPL